MIQRKKHLDYILIRFAHKQKYKTKNILKKSFLTNYFLLPINRLSFIVRKNFQTKHNKFSNSQNKLQCRMDYSFSVPTKKLKYSRFYLTKSADRLMHGGYQKK